MSEFLSLLKIMLLCGTILAAMFIGLLSLPKSRLRSVVLKLAGYAVALLSALWVVNPLDGDWIPLVGWFDDGVAIVTGIGGFCAARSAQRELDEGFDD